MVKKDEEAAPADSAPTAVETQTPQAGQPVPNQDAGSVGSPRMVEVVDKDGGVTSVSHPAALNSLVFGSGYKIKDERTVDQAVAFLSGEDA
jgi:hypothetical protein